MTKAAVIGDGAKVPSGVATGVYARLARDTNPDVTRPGNHALAPIGGAAPAIGERREQ